MTDAILEFRGQYRFLSNFWPAIVHLDDIPYPTVEHAYQAAKSLDPLYRGAIQKCESPGEAKRLGRTIKLRDVWLEMRVGVMTVLVREKFTVHRELRSKLLGTGASVLIEGNSWNDRFWGKCRGVGENQLGRILMQVREELR